MEDLISLTGFSGMEVSKGLLDFTIRVPFSKKHLQPILRSKPDSSSTSLNSGTL
jgi:hypothetical protein